MPSPPDIVGEGIAFGLSTTAFIRLFVHPDEVQILLLRYLMNGLSNVDETYREYSLAPNDDLKLLDFEGKRSKVTVTADGSEGIHGVEVYLL